MYGFFKCSKCGKLWESARVYPKKGRNSYYGQECKDCRVMCQPYRVEATVCSMCGLQASLCDCDKEHHVDPSKSHRSDLCEKCKSGRSCDY